jgi:hypothetical protein
VNAYCSSHLPEKTTKTNDAELNTHLFTLREKMN